MEKGRVDRNLASGLPYERGGEPVESCTLITTAANGVVALVHDRMPVILKPEHHARWLDPEERRPAALAGLLAPPPEDWLAAHPVSKRVNNPRNEGPRCVESTSPMARTTSSALSGEAD
jgi:putative SOS response-associated peptidase YedK